MAATPQPDHLSSLEERLSQLERLLQTQAERMATQEAEISAQREEIARLSAPTTPPIAMPRSIPPALPAVEPEPVVTSDERPAGTHVRKSRRALLKLGGAAAAAGMAAVAAGATELAHPGTAHANGVSWQTGIVNADNQTFVEPSNGSFPDPTLLTVRVGTVNATYHPLSAANSAAIAAYDITGLAQTIGVYATSEHGLGVYGNVDTGVGVAGNSYSGTGVSGGSGIGDGVVGSAGNGRGVYGNSYSGAGVHGYSSSGAGVSGLSGIGAGVYGTGGGGSVPGIGVWGDGRNRDTGVYGVSVSGYGGVFQGGQAPLFLQAPGGVIGSPASGGHNFGELFVDGAGVFWACTGTGTPGTWIRLCGPLSGVAGGALNYLSAPIRIFDSRVGQPAPLPVSKAPLAGGTTYTIPVTGTTVGGLSVPAGATGVFGNLTVTDTQGGGDLILFPHGAPQPLTSNINYEPGKTIANAVNVGLSTDGKIDLYVHVSGTDVIIDIAGYVL